MGNVYLVYDRFHKKEVALKTLRAHIDSLAAKENLRREFAIMTHLRDPFLVSVYDLWFNTLSMQPFFTMEYIEGSSLKYCIRRMPVMEMLLLLLKITRALAGLHALKILHLDIKTSNVMIRSKTREPVLMDFGISKFLPEVTADQVAGTIPYMAPEIFATAERPTPFADIFSMGVLFYYTLTGRFPVQPKQDRKLAYLYQAYREAAYPQPVAIEPRIPLSVNQLIMDMLSLDPHNRPDTQTVQNILQCALPATVNRLAPAKGMAYLFHSRFISRETERTRINTQFHAMGQNKPPKYHAIQIMGPAGIGKSRLLSELTHDAQLSSVLPLVLSCLPGFSAGFTAMFDLFQQLRTYLDSGQLPLSGGNPDQAFHTTDLWSTSHHSLLQTKADYNAFQLGDQALDDSAIEPKSRSPVLSDLVAQIDGLVKKYQSPGITHDLFKAVKARSTRELYFNTFQLFSTVAAKCPFVMLIDDIDHDTSMKEFVRQFLEYVRYVQNSCFFIVCTARKALFGAQGQPALTAIQLPPLNRKESRRLVESMLMQPLPETANSQVYRASRGNPFLLQEYLRFLVHKNVIVWTNAGWRVDKALMGKTNTADKQPTAVLLDNLRSMTSRKRDVMAWIAASPLPLEERLLSDLLLAYPGWKKLMVQLEEEQLLTSRYLPSGFKVYSLMHHSYRPLLLQETVTKTTNRMRHNLAVSFCHYHGTLFIPCHTIACLAYKTRQYAMAYVFGWQAAKRSFGRNMMAESIRMANLAAYSLERISSTRDARYYRRHAHLAAWCMEIWLYRGNMLVAKQWLLKIARGLLACFHKPRYTQYLYNKRNLYLAMKMPERAVRACRRLMTLYKDPLSKAYINNLGTYSNLLRSQQKYLQAGSVLKEVKHLVYQKSNKRQIGLFHLMYGSFLHEVATQNKRENEKLSAILKQYNLAIATAREIGYPYLLGASLHNASRVLQQQGNTRLALRYAREAVDCFKSMGRFSCLARAYERLSMLLLATKQFKTLIQMANEMLPLFLRYPKGMQTWYFIVCYECTIEACFYNLNMPILHELEARYVAVFHSEPVQYHLLHAVTLCLKSKLALLVDADEARCRQLLVQLASSLSQMKQPFSKMYKHSLTVDLELLQIMSCILLDGNSCYCREMSALLHKQEALISVEYRIFYALIMAIYSAARAPDQARIFMAYALRQDQHIEYAMFKPWLALAKQYCMVHAGTAAMDLPAFHAVVEKICSSQDNFGRLLVYIIGRALPLRATERQWQLISASLLPGNEAVLRQRLDKFYPQALQTFETRLLGELASP